MKSKTTSGSSRGCVRTTTTLWKMMMATDMQTKTRTTRNDTRTNSRTKKPLQKVQSRWGHTKASYELPWPKRLLNDLSFLSFTGSKKNGKGKIVDKNAPKPKARENIMDAFMKAEARPKISRPAPVRDVFFLAN